jgi:hypothetical protein
LGGETVKIGTDKNGRAVLRASNLSENSLWSEYSHISSPDTLSKGSVQVMSLGSLKDIFNDPSAYSDRLSKLSVLVIRNNA